MAMKCEIDLPNTVFGSSDVAMQAGWCQDESFGI
jgi:hypothetical protein